MKCNSYGIISKMSRKIYLIVLALIVFTSTAFYVAQFVAAHSGGGTTAHGDTIDVKIMEVWVGTSSADLTKVFSGPSDGPVTITATQDQFMKLVGEVRLTTVDTILDDTPIIKEFRENGPDIEEEVIWNDFITQHYYYSPTDTIHLNTTQRVSDILKLDDVADDQLLISVVGWFGVASTQDSHTVNDSATLVVQPPGGGPGPGPSQTLGVNLTASPTSITAGQSTSLTADVSGTAQGTIHYQFDCTNNGGYEVDVTNNTDPYSTNACKYPSPGTYTARVRVERGTAPPASDTVTIKVSEVAPTGYHEGTDNAACETWGWARDADMPNTPVEVHVYVDAPAGSGNSPVYAATADQPRTEPSWPFPDKNHGFKFTLPAGLKDGKQHQLYIYPIDTTTKLGNPSNILNNSPRPIQCGYVTPPSPVVNPGVPFVDIRAQ